MKMLTLLRRCAVPVLLAAAACDGGGATGAATPARILAVATVSQDAFVGTPVPESPAVRVLDAHGRGMAGVSVAFFVTTGGGRAPPTVRTGGDGIARAEWVVGTAVGENVLAASVAALPPVIFRADALPGEPSSVEKVGDGQTSEVGSSPPDSVGVRVTDRFGNGLAGVRVTFGGRKVSLSPYRVATGPNGYARVEVTVWERPGTYPLYAIPEEMDTVWFTVHSVAGPPAVIDPNPYTNRQTAEAGSPVLRPPSVYVRDRLGNLLPGVSVTFTPDPGSGTVVGGTMVTDAEGGAELNEWRLGSPGPNRLIASVAGVEPAVFTATSLGPCGSLVYTLYEEYRGALLTNRCTLEKSNAEVHPLTLPPNQGVEITLSTLYFRPYLRLLDAQGTTLLITNEVEYTHTARLYLFAPAGQYALAVPGYGSAGGDAYTIRSQAVTETHGCAGRLLFPGITIQDGARGGCFIYSLQSYSVPLKARDRVRVTLSPTATVHARLRVLSSRNEVLAEAVGSGPGEEVQVDLTVSLDGGYTVQVQDEGDLGGQFSLRVDRQ